MWDPSPNLIHSQSDNDYTLNDINEVVSLCNTVYIRGYSDQIPTIATKPYCCIQCFINNSLHFLDATRVA